MLVKESLLLVVLATLCYLTTGDDNNYEYKIDCPAGFTKIGTKCYLYSDALRFSYAQAQAYCKTQDGAYLAMPKTQAELDAVISVRTAFGNSLIPRRRKKKQHFLWIGLDDIKTEGDWNFNDGIKLAGGKKSPLWYPGQPGGTKRHRENCGMIWLNDKFNDVKCDFKQNSIVCEKAALPMKVIIPRCPAKWTQKGNRCYLYDARLKATYVQAQNVCKEFGGHLAMPKTQAELDDVIAVKDARVRTLTGKARRIQHWLWIGLDDIKTEGTFIFNDGTKLAGGKNSPMWHPGQPDNSNGDDCVQTFYDDNLNDCKCNDQRNGIMCQKGALPVEPDTKDCPADWIRLRNMCYKLGGEKENYATARRLCKAAGGYLAMPKAQADLDDLVAVRSTGKLNHPLLWIGLDDIKTEGKFVWNDGTSLEGGRYFPLWGNGEQVFKGKQAQEQDCGHIFTTDRLKDAKCNSKGLYICQKARFCYAIPCQNGGKCTAAGECKCKPGFTGRTCGKAIDRCAASPCRNGGVCTGPGKCKCLPGFSGKTCAKKVTVKCDNKNNMCAAWAKKGVCQRSPKYMNKNCCKACDKGKQNKNRCAANPCKNGGVCNVSGKCKCLPGFSGKTCAKASRIIMMNRVNGKVNFDRNMADYEKGFGNCGTGDCWVGLKTLHHLCSKNCEIGVALKYKGKSYWLYYSTFKVGPKGDNYRLTIGGYRGNAFDHFGLNNNMRFTTKDIDNDRWKKNCASVFTGGWWYNKCFRGHPTGTFGSTAFAKGINWKDLTGFRNSLSSILMKVKRKD